jgi:hypothetical protein
MMSLGASAACDDGVPSDEHYFDNFKTVVANAPNEGWTAYWLGKSFQAGGLEFNGPYVADFGDELTGGARATYAAPPSGPILSLFLYSEAGWREARQQYSTKPVGNVSRHVTIAGVAATIESSPGGTRPVNVITAYVPLGNTMVVAVANSGGSATPGGPDVNPLIDEQTFLDVLQHLRPYPQ